MREAIGAVRALSAVEAVHSRKVILNRRKLERCLRRAIGHAHDADEFNASTVVRSNHSWLASWLQGMNSSSASCSMVFLNGRPVRSCLPDRR